MHNTVFRINVCQTHKYYTVAKKCRTHTVVFFFFVEYVQMVHVLNVWNVLNCISLQDIYCVFIFFSGIFCPSPLVLSVSHLLADVWTGEWSSPRAGAGGRWGHKEDEEDRRRSVEGLPSKRFLDVYCVKERELSGLTHIWNSKLQDRLNLVNRHKYRCNNFSPIHRVLLSSCRVAREKKKK